MSDTQWQEQHDEHAELLRLVNEVHAQMTTRIPLHPNLRPFPQGQWTQQFQTRYAPMRLNVHMLTSEDGLLIRLALDDGTPLGEHHWKWGDVCSVCEGRRWDYKHNRMCAACKGTGIPPQPVEVKR